MGFAPQDVDAMSLGQWVAVATGVARAHASAEGKVAPPTEDEFRAAVANGFN